MLSSPSQHDEQFSRTKLLIGEAGVATLKASRVIVFGCGGVGGFAVEALARAGIGALDIVDGDVVTLSNLNRQIVALHSTLGKSKVRVMAERIRDINPECRVAARERFFLPENADGFDFSQYDYVVDAVDTVSAKIEIIKRAKAAGVPVISCMGAGNKLDASRFRIADISETSVCPLARAVRHELKKCGVERVKVLYSTEKPASQKGTAQKSAKKTPASISFVPSVAGLLIAGEVVRELLKREESAK